jgi:hypothetical protein
MKNALLPNKVRLQMREGQHNTARRENDGKDDWKNS